MEYIIELDRLLFALINGAWSNPVFDVVLPLLREKLVWAPLYVFIIAFVWVNYPKKIFFFLWMLFLVISLADLTSSKLIKNTVKRPRPCHEFVEHKSLNLRVNCGSGYSFTSSHATNHFAVAVFLILTVGQRFKKLKWPLLIWAAGIAYAQVYVGVHYPFDVLAGAILGTLIAHGIGLIFRQFPEMAFDH